MSAHNTQPSLHVVDEQARGQQRRSPRLRAGSLHDEVVLPVRKWGEKAHHVGVSILREDGGGMATSAP